MHTKKQKRPPQRGMIYANIKLPLRLHQAMKTLEQLRNEDPELEEPIHLWKLYREAVEQYISAEPQQRLLNSKGESAA